MIAMLQRCGSCGKFLNLNSEEVPSDAIIKSVKAPKYNLRTVVVNINQDLYEKIHDLAEGREDINPIISEIIALGLVQYDRIRAASRK